MRRHRLTRPEGTYLRRCFITDSKDEIHMRCTGYPEFFPVLPVEPIGRVAVSQSAGACPAFTNRYPNWASMHIAGEFQERYYFGVRTLSNSGEELELEDGLGNRLLQSCFVNGCGLLSISALADCRIRFVER